MVAVLGSAWATQRAPNQKLINIVFRWKIAQTIPLLVLTSDWVGIPQPHPLMVMHKHTELWNKLVQYLSAHFMHFFPRVWPFSQFPNQLLKSITSLVLLLPLAGLDWLIYWFSLHHSVWVWIRLPSSSVNIGYCEKTHLLGLQFYLRTKLIMEWNAASPSHLCV